MTEPISRIEHPPKPIDLVAIRSAAVEKLFQQAWSTNATEAQSHWKKLTYSEGKALYYDPNVMETSTVIDYKPNLDDPEANGRMMAEHVQSWRYLGSTGREHHFISVYLNQLHLPVLPGVELLFARDDKADPLPLGDNFKLTIGTLHMDAIPQDLAVPLNYPWRAADTDWERTLSLQIGRRQPGYFARGLTISPYKDHKREPELTEPGLLREMTMGFRQLRLMGFKHVIGEPTDPRRLRIYTKLGMTPVRHNGTTYTDLDLEHWPRLQRQ